LNSKAEKSKSFYLEDMRVMDLEAAQAIAGGLKLVGAGLAMTGAIGAGAGVGIVVGGAVQGIARNPDAAGQITTNMILGIAFAEAVAIYALVVALIILFVA
jgi:F-type H+-transporting ATPase subunit c